MIEIRTRAVLLSLVGALALSVASAAGCSGGGGDDDDDDDGTTNTPVEVCTPIPGLTFSQIQTSIFTPQCATSLCHDTETPGTNNLNLSAGSSYNELVGVNSVGTFNGSTMVLVQPSNASLSYLYVKLTTAPPAISGSQMPNSVPTLLLCPEKIDAIAAWIDSGAQMN